MGAIITKISIHNLEAIKKIVVTVALAYLMLLLNISGFAQTKFLPENIGDNINTAEAEINPILSPDGKTLYFTRIIPASKFGEWERQEIWYSQLQKDATWGTPIRMPDHVNLGRFNSVLGTSSDGQTLYINGVFNKNGTMWKKRGMSTIKKDGENWRSPEPVNVKGWARKSKSTASNAYVSNDNNFLILAFSKGYNYKKLNLWVSKNKGSKWSNPKKLGYTINTFQSEEAPFLSNNNETLYFTRVKNNKHDIYVSNRLDNSWKNWSEPKKLSDTINSAKWDSYFKTNQKGSIAYFSSDNNSKGKADIFKIKLFEENPFILVKGIVVNKTTNKPISSKYNFKILVDGKVVDSIRVSSDSASYTAKLPFGKSYTIAASVPNFIPQNETIDATAIKEFTSFNKNLYVKPLPYVMLVGKVLDKETNGPIPVEANPTLVINGIVMDSVKIDPLTGAYSLQIPYGKSHKLQAAATKYEPETERLDLTDVIEYKEINLNLYASIIKEKVATITGYIYDKKTNQPIIGEVPLKVIVNGEESANASIDKAKGTYTIELPLGANYTINATGPNYYPVYETVDLKSETEAIRVMKDLNLVPIEIGQSVRLNNIFFATGKATLKKESFPELDRVSKFLSDNNNIKVEIAGHTDNVGNAASNLKLSNARAKSVADYIIKKGIPKTQISSKGYGLTKPVSDNKTALGRSLNRRVEFTILDK